MSTVGNMLTTYAKPLWWLLDFCAAAESAVVAVFAVVSGGNEVFVVRDRSVWSLD